jgi:hypothetical protein
LKRGYFWKKPLKRSRFDLQEVFKAKHLLPKLGRKAWLRLRDFA